MESPLAATLGARMSAYLTSAVDYKKQRKRLNKGLLKVRRELDLITRDTKNYKEKEKTSKINKEDYDQDQRYGLVLLLTAERDILYALEIKNLLEISNDKASSYKNLMISKIKKSLLNSKKLLEVVANEKDDFKRIEYYIYASLIQGFLSINKKQWSLALNAFSIARCALDFLYSQHDSNIDDEEELNQFNKTLINEVMDTLVDPSLNLAISQDDSFNFTTTDLKSISRKHCHDKNLPYLQPVVQLVQKHDSSFVSEISSSISLIKSIKWREYEARLYNDELAYKIMKLTNDDETNWKQFNDANQFDSLLTGWSELLEIHNNDLEKNQDEDDLDKVQNRAIVLTYINYNLLFTKIKRDLLIIDQLLAAKKIANNKDIIRLYGTVISTTQELKDLPGVYNDEDLYQSLDNLEKFFMIKKTIILAESFTFNSKFPEALKIYDYIQNELLTVEDTFYSIDNFPYNITSNEEFNNFKHTLSNTLLQAHISAQFSHDFSSHENIYVVENLNKYPTSDLKNIVNLGEKPRLQPILSKPVLFDIGYNYINYDLGRSSSSSRNTSSNISVGQEETKKRSGFFGIFGRG